MQDYNIELRSYKLFCNKNFNFKIEYKDQDIIELFGVMTLLEITSTYDEKVPDGFTYFSALAHEMMVKLLYSYNTKEPLFTDMCERQISEYLFKLIYLLTINSKISLVDLSHLSFRNFWNDIKKDLNKKDGNTTLKKNKEIIMKLHLIYSNNSGVIHSKEKESDIGLLLSDIIRRDSTLNLTNIQIFHNILVNVIYKLANVNSDFMSMHQKEIFGIYKKYFH